MVDNFTRPQWLSVDLTGPSLDLPAEKKITSKMSVTDSELISTINELKI